MTNKSIARVLKETASLIELTGGNSFRARAFSSAARTIDRLDEPVTTLLDEDRLTEIRGIGAGLADQIAELVATGTFTQYEDLMSAIPAGLNDVLRVKGLGAKKVRQLWQQLGVTSLEDLEHAAQAGRIAELSGFGKKTQDRILEQIRLLRTYLAQRHYAEAVSLVAPLLERLRGVVGVQQVEVAGALRRKMETIDVLDVVVATEVPEAIRGALVTNPTQTDDAELLLEGELDDGFPYRVWVTEPERFGTVLWQQTGSEAHLAAFVERYGEPAVASDEAGIYAAAGLAPIPPELREDRGEWTAAEQDDLPALLHTDDLRGTLHNHSTYSDGAHTLREMAEAARGMGLSYFGICDHSQSLSIASGLSIDEVRAQHREIDALNDEFASDGGSPFRIFKGIESDILTDGQLDYPEEVLETFDFIVASVHSGFNMSEDAATERLLTAIANPHTSILGHATGRLLLRREGYPIDHERVIAACAEHGVAIELNANPYRLDMDWRWLHRATQQGVRIAINPDAHSIEQLRYVQWGVAVARKGWLTADQCLNALSLEAFTDWLDARRTARSA